MADATKPNFALLLTAGIDAGKYGNPDAWVAKARMVVIAEDGKPRGFSNSFYDGTMGYEGHYITAHLSETNAARGERAYAHDPSVETLGGYMGLTDAIETGKVAAAIRRSLDKQYREDGPAPTFSEQFVRYAKALGVKRFIVKVSGTSDIYSENEWAVLTHAQARDWLDRREEQYRLSHAPSTGTIAVPA